MMTCLSKTFKMRVVEANMDESSDDNALINFVGENRQAPARGCARGGRGRGRSIVR